MAGMEALTKFIPDASALDSLDKTALEKLSCFVNTLNENVDEWKTKYEVHRVNSDQQYFELEKQLISSNTKLNSKSMQNEEERKRLEELEKKHSEVTLKLKELEEMQKGCLSTELRLTKANEHLESEKREIVLLLEKRNREVDQLNDECKTLSEKLAAANTAKCEALAKMDEIQSTETVNKYRHTRSEQEREQLQKQVDWLNNELQKKIQETQNTSRDKAATLLEVQAHLEEKTEEAKLLQESVDMMKKKNAEQSSKIESYMQKLKDVRDDQIKTDEQFQLELQAQAKLVTLYKVQAEESETKMNELTRAVEELQKLLKEAAEAYTELEKEKTAENEKYLSEINKNEERIKDLEQELINANEFLNPKSKVVESLSDATIEALSPTAAATSKLLKSGMTLSQIYNEYVKTVEALQLEKEENKRHNQYMDQILQEIEEKAPILRQQKEDYEQALQSITQLTHQLDMAMIESQKLRTDSDEAKRKLKYSEREIKKLQQQTTDLGRQVQYLLRQVEELKGGHIASDNEEDLSFSEVSSSSQLISEKLVKFKNLKELQEQNQCLLEVVRELSEKKEEEEAQQVEIRTMDLQKGLQTAMEELEELKSLRNRQIEMIESIVRQRDMYRVLLEHSGHTTLPLHGSTPGPKGLSMAKLPPCANKDLDDTKMALKELQSEYSTYKREKCENEKVLTEQLEKMRAECSNLRVQNARLTSQLDYAVERYKILQTNNECQKKEINILKQKTQKYSITVAKLEQTVNTLHLDLTTAQESSSRLEVHCENMKAERDLLKNAEQRLLQEKENMLREQRSQNILLTNLQTIQNNLERVETETKFRLNHQMEQLEREKNSLKRKVGSVENEQKAEKTQFENQIQEIRKQLEQELTMHHKTKDQLHKSFFEMNRAKEELSVSESKLAAAEIKLKTTGKENVNNDELVSLDDVKDLKTKLNEYQIEIQSSKDQVEKLKQHVEQYKAIAESLEKNLREQNEASKLFQKTSDKKMQEIKEAKEWLEKQAEDLEKERQLLLDENIQITEESHKLNADLRKQLSNLQNELQEAIECRKFAVANEQMAQEELRAQVKLAAEAQDKYERELILHAADVEALTTLKKVSEEHNQKLNAANEATVQITKSFEETKASWAEQEKILKSELSQVEERCQNLTSQNSILHEQMEKFSSQVSIVQKTTAKDASLNTSVEGREKSSEQLLEVIKFLRREKEISATRLDMVQAESLRIKQRFIILEKQLEDAKKCLSEEREKAQITVHTASQHAELMRKVDNLNVLTDSNNLLRQERENLSQQVKELEAKNKKLESDIQPLQATIRDLTSQKEALAADKIQLQNESERWKTRTNHLIEQCNRSDPEEHKKIIQEREELRKSLNAANEENHKRKSENSRLNMNYSNLQKELTTTKQEVTKLNNIVSSLKAQMDEKRKEVDERKKEVDEKKKEVDEKNKEVAEKVLTISQLKRIGRKYKEAAEALKTKQDQSGSEADKTAVLEQTKANAIATEKCIAAEKERDEMKERAQNLELEVNGAKEKIGKLEEDVVKLKESHAKMKSDNEEYEKKQIQSKAVLQTAKSKLTSQKDQIEKQTLENEELKKKLESLEHVKEESELRLATLKSQYDGQIARLEKELEEAKQAATAALVVSELKQTLDRVQRENNEMQARIQLLQKHLEAQQKQLSTQPSVSRTSAPSAATDRLSLPISEAPKMANIRPMTSTPASVRQTSVQPASAAAAAKATASIRPMAIAPTPAVPVSAATPTATVMPTTVTSQDTHEAISDSPPATQLSPAAVRPTQQIQRVTPQIEQVPEPPQPEIQVESEPSSSSSSSSTSNITGLISEESASEMQLPLVSTSQLARDMLSVPSTSSLQPGKRSREDAEVLTEDTDSQIKRPKTTQDQSSIPVITVTDEQTQTIILEPEDLSELRTAVLPCVTISEAAANQMQTVVVRQQPEQILNDDVIVVDSDDGDQDLSAEVIESRCNIEYPEETMGGYDEDEDDDDDADDEDEVDIQDENGDDMEEQYSESQESMHAETEQGISDQDDDDVVIVDEEETGQQMEARDEEELPPPPGQDAMSVTTSSVAQRPPPPLQPIPAHTERLPSVGRSQLTPFLFQGPPGPFEEGDDCTVPSTPTLFVPRRGDGFAEAVSSPQVPQRFVFGSSSEATASHSELESQGALGMDDTRMDLSQFDEGQGRSVPNISQPITTVPSATDQSVDSRQMHSEVPNVIALPLSETIELVVVPEVEAETSQQGAISPETAKEVRSEVSVTVEEPANQPRSETEQDARETTPAPVEGTAASSQEILIFGEQEKPTEGSEKPGTASLEKNDPQGLKKTRIQPIVWDEPSGPGATPVASSSQGVTTSSPAPTPTPPSPTPSKGRAGRPAAASRSFRGGFSRGRPAGRGRSRAGKGPAYR